MLFKHWEIFFGYTKKVENFLGSQILKLGFLFYLF